MIFNGSPINPGVKKELLQKVLNSKNVQIQKQQQQQLQQQQQQLLLNQNKSIEIEDDEEEDENNCDGEENSFVVTPDYIQQSKYKKKQSKQKTPNFLIKNNFQQ